MQASSGWRTRARAAARVAGLAAGLLAAGCEPEQRDRPDRPSVLVIAIDALRADHVRHLGYDRPSTPTLDRLAAEGVSFRQAFAAAPLETVFVESRALAMAVLADGEHGRPGVDHLHGHQCITLLQVDADHPPCRTAHRPDVILTELDSFPIRRA